MICPRCKRTLTGSASRGRHGNRFFYYHCNYGCKERQKALEINDTFERMLHDFKVNQNALDLHGAVMTHIVNQNNTENRLAMQEVNKEIERQGQRIKNARSMAADGEISADDFKAMKNDALEALGRLEAKAKELKDGTIDYEVQVNWCVNLLRNIDTVYHDLPVEKKQRIIGSIFPEKLRYEEGVYRTPAVNRVVDLICSNSRQLKGDKKRKYTFLDVLSGQVVSTRIELVSKV